MRRTHTVNDGSVTKRPRTGHTTPHTVRANAPTGTENTTPSDSESGIPPTPLDVPAPAPRSSENRSEVARSLMALAQDIPGLPRHEAAAYKVTSLRALLPHVSTPHEMNLVMDVADRALLEQHPELLLALTDRIAAAAHSDTATLCAAASRCLDAARKSPVKEAVWGRLIDDVRLLDLLTALDLFNCLTHLDREADIPPALLETVEWMETSIKDRVHAQTTHLNPWWPTTVPTIQAPEPWHEPLPRELAQKIGENLARSERARLRSSRPHSPFTNGALHDWKAIGRDLLNWSLTQRSHLAATKPWLAAIQWEVRIRMPHTRMRLLLSPDQAMRIDMLTDPSYEAMRFVPLAPDAAVHRLDQLLCQAFSHTSTQIPLVSASPPFNIEILAHVRTKQLRAALAETYGHFVEKVLARMQRHGNALDHNDYVALTQLPVRAIAMAHRLLAAHPRDPVLKTLFEEILRHLDVFTPEVQVDALIDILLGTGDDSVEPDQRKALVTRIRALNAEWPGATDRMKNTWSLVHTPAKVDNQQVDAALLQLSQPTQNWGTAAFAQLNAIFTLHRTPAREPLLVQCAANLLREFGRLADLVPGISSWIQTLNLPTELMHKAVMQLTHSERQRLFIGWPIGPIVPLIESLAADESISIADRLDFLQLQLENNAPLGIISEITRMHLERLLQNLRQRQGTDTPI